MKAIDAALKNPVGLAIGAAVLIGAVYFLGRKTLTDAAAGVGGIATGNNAITRGTAYEGAGIVGTVAGAIDKTSGGIFSDLGSALGGWLYESTHSNYDGEGKQTEPKVLQEGAANTDSLWGRLGGVLLRSN